MTLRLTFVVENRVGVEVFVLADTVLDGVAVLAANLHRQVGLAIANGEGEEAESWHRES